MTTLTLAHGGTAGLLDLGYVAFYAMGAYSFALLSTHFEFIGFWTALPLAGLLAAFWGIILGFPVLRLRGDYLAIVTLAFGEIIRIVILNWYDFTNGPNGISGIPRPTFFGLEFSRGEDGVAAYREESGRLSPQTLVDRLLHLGREKPVRPQQDGGQIAAGDRQRFVAERLRRSELLRLLPIRLTRGRVTLTRWILLPLDLLRLELPLRLQLPPQLLADLDDLRDDSIQDLRHRLARDLDELRQRYVCARRMIGPRKLLVNGGVDISQKPVWIEGPHIFQKDGWYYLFFGANDIQNDQQAGGIGVARARRPEGPFEDYLGKPLIDRFHNGAQPIDQFVFRDEDGAHYLIYGGWRHCNIARLNDTFTGFVPFPDGTTFREITPAGYVEGAYMLKRDGRYYFMWSENDTRDEDYRVAYATGPSPLGPWTKRGVVLQKRLDLGIKGPGHHSVVKAPNSDTWHVAYHRFAVPAGNGTNREVTVDRMTFNADGTIAPIVPTP